MRDVLRWYDKHGVTHRTHYFKQRGDVAWCCSENPGFEIIGKWVPADTPITCLQCHRKEVTWPE